MTGGEKRSVDGLDSGRGRSELESPRRVPWPVATLKPPLIPLIASPFIRADMLLSNSELPKDPPGLMSEFFGRVDDEPIGRASSVSILP
jgi:hypothetical protein